MTRTTAEPKAAEARPPDKITTRREPRPELRAMSRIDDALRPLSGEEVARVLCWLNACYGVDHFSRTVTRTPDLPPEGFP